MSANGSRETPLRVSILLADLQLGGVERFSLNLSRGLSQRGVEVEIILVNGIGELMSEVPAGVSVVDLRAPRALSSLPCLVSYLREKRPDALISGQDHISVVALLAKLLARTKTQVVVTQHTMSSLDSGSGGGSRKMLVPRLMRTLYRFADELVAVSESTRKDLIRTAGKTAIRTKVIYVGAVTPEFLGSLKASVEHPWFAEGRPPVVLAAGRLTPISRGHKDFATLIRAFAIVRKSIDARLMILGEGEDRERLTLLISELGLDDSVQLPGFAPNPGAYMARSSVFVLSSLWECLPAVAIEALAAGTPVVATDCAGGIREIIRDEQCGVLVPVGDPQAMAEAIKGVIIGSHAKPREETWSRFTFDTMIDRYMEVLLPEMSR